MDHITLTREQLYELIWSEPFSSLAKKYKISDVGLRKMCVKLKIPLPPKGYWLKEEFSRNSTKTVTLFYRNKDKVSVNSVESEQTKLKKKLKDDPNLPLNVPNVLTDPNKLISSTKDFFLRQNPSRNSFPGFLESRGDVLDIRVAPENLDRALRIMDTFLKLINARGHEIILEDNKTYLNIGEIKKEVSLKEKMTIEKNIDGKFPSVIYNPTGKFSFSVGNNMVRNDGKLGLENKLAEILSIIEDKVREEKEIRERFKEQERIRKEIETQRKLTLEIKNNEKEKFQKLLTSVEKWEKSKNIRLYINELEILDNNPSVEKIDFIKWAKEKADWYDPLIQKDDKILGLFDSSYHSIT